MEQDEERRRGGTVQSVLVQPEFIEGDHERDLEGHTGRALNARLRALNLNLSVTGCHAGTCLLGCLPVSSTDKVLRMKESYPKSSLFISIKSTISSVKVKTGGIIMLRLL